MHYFQFKRNKLYCEGVLVSDLAKRFGTPLYVYSQRTILEHFIKLRQAFAPVKPLICYSVKANSNLSILKLLVSKGAGLDIVSGGELFRAKKVGCQPQRIVYASVGKTESEIRAAIKYGILFFNVESVPELAKINRVAAQLNKCVSVVLRLNPDITPQTHAYITTGKKETKFGMDSETVKTLLFSQGRYANLCIKGIHLHIGSQITQAQPFIAAIKKVTKLIRAVQYRGVRLDFLNIGGGLGIVYDNEKPQTAQSFAKKVLPLLKNLGLKIILEPGRFIVGNAGILVTTVTYVKETQAKHFIIVDAGMNDLVRPSLYNAHHTIIPLHRKRAAASKRMPRADVVGPICESGDFLGKNRQLTVSEGEYLAVLGAGAYGFTMSSNYNSRPRCAEVLVSNKAVRVIRKREQYRDLISKELNV